MKKIYIAPNTDIVKVQTENLLVVASSGGDVNSVSGGSDYVGADHRIPFAAEDGGIVADPYAGAFGTATGDVCDHPDEFLLADLPH
jgi:hypothetical protein